MTAAGSDQPVLGIDLGAVQDNYIRLQELAPDSRLAAVLKADAYGLGAAEVSLALYAAGCRAFYVATSHEALTLVPLLDECGDDYHIATFAGLMPDQSALYDCPRLFPVLNTPEQIALWREWRKPQPAYIHVDTGMNRLGLRPEQWSEISACIDFSLHAVISHLIDAENPDADSPEQQFQKIQQIQNYKLSFANSAASLCNSDWALDQRRVGIALYGVSPLINTGEHRLKPVLRLEVPVLQQRCVKAGESVGYGHHYIAPRDHTVLTLGIGYNDGIPRAVTFNNRRCDVGAYIGDELLPLIGRVSMDTMAARVPDRLLRRNLDFSRVSLLNTRQGIEILARASNTIPHETLTRLGSRLYRYYTR